MMLKLPSCGLCFPVDTADSRCGSRGALFQAKAAPCFSLLTNLFAPSRETTSCILTCEVQRAMQSFHPLGCGILSLHLPGMAVGDGAGCGMAPSHFVILKGAGGEGETTTHRL